MARNTEKSLHFQSISALTERKRRSQRNIRAIQRTNREASVKRKRRQEGKGREGKRKGREGSRRLNGAHPLPDDFKLTDELITYAASKGVTNRKVIENFHEGFILQHKAKGYKNRDHVATWQTWFRNDIASGKIRPDPKRTAKDF